MPAWANVWLMGTANFVGLGDVDVGRGVMGGVGPVGCACTGGRNDQDHRKGLADRHPLRSSRHLLGGAHRVLPALEEEMIVQDRDHRPCASGRGVPGPHPAL